MIYSKRIYTNDPSLQFNSTLLCREMGRRASSQKNQWIPTIASGRGTFESLQCLIRNGCSESAVLWAIPQSRWFMGFSGSLNTRSGFLEMSPMPLIVQYMSQEGERKPPLLGRYSSCFLSIWYPFQPLDQADVDQWPRFNEHVGGSELYSTPPQWTRNFLYHKNIPSLGPPLFILYSPQYGFRFIGRLQIRKRFSRNEPESTHPSTHGSGRRENTAYIERVFSWLLFHPIRLTTVGSNSNRSMA